MNSAISNIFNTLKYSVKYLGQKLFGSKPTTSATASTQAVWQKLLDSEVQLRDLMEEKVTPSNVGGDIDMGLALYLLNHYVFFPIVWILRLFGMPNSTISKENLETWKMQCENAEILSGNGMYISFRKFELFDLHWLEVIYNYILVHLHLEKLHDFNITPAHLDLSTADELSINVVGDFGTGKWQDGIQEECPAVLVQKQMELNKSDIHIHIGDIYYAGTKAQARDGFLATWSPGKQMSFNMNGNHDTYSGDEGYYEVTLKDPAFAKQNNTSYFSFLFHDCLFLGIDTSYDSDAFFCSRGRLTNPEQIAFLKEKVTGHKGKIIVFTHHGPFSSAGTEEYELWNDMITALGVEPDVWYFGHIHNAIVYNTSAIGNVKTQFRCIGHGGLPFGPGFDLEAELGKNIKWCANKPLAKPGIYQKKRLMNGFLNLTIKDNVITETIINQDGSVGYTGTL